MLRRAIQSEIDRSMAKGPNAPVVETDWGVGVYQKSDPRAERNKKFLGKVIEAPGLF